MQFKREIADGPEVQCRCPRPERGTCVRCTGLRMLDTTRGRMEELLEVEVQLERLKVELEAAHARIAELELDAITDPEAGRGFPDDDGDDEYPIEGVYF